MPQTRKLVRDAAVAILSNGSTGLNARLASIADEYGIGAYIIDWGSKSGSFLQGYFNPAELDVSQIDHWPAINIYTSDLVNENRSKPRTFSGTITLHVDIWIQFRAGVEHDDIESVADALEQSAIEALFADAAAWPAGVVPSPLYQVPKEPAELLGDGWTQRIPIIFPCEVDA